MPLYKFQLRDGSLGIEDETGVTLADSERALEYGHQVVRELMSCRERETRTWRLEIFDRDGDRLFQIPFASIDETLNHLTPDLRARIEDLCDRGCSLSEVMSVAAVTMRESRALVALSRGKPYLAAEFGRRIIGP